MILCKHVSCRRIGRESSIAIVLTLLALPAWALAQNEEQPRPTDAAEIPRERSSATEAPPLVVDDALEPKTPEKAEGDPPKSRERGQRQARRGEPRKDQERARDEPGSRNDEQAEQREKARAEVERLEVELSKAQEQLHAQAREAMERMRKEMQESQERVSDQMRQLHAARQRLAELGGEFDRPEGRPFPGRFNPRFRFRMVPEDRDEGRPDQDEGLRERGDRPGPPRLDRGDLERDPGLERRLNRLEQKFDRLLDELNERKRERGPREVGPERERDRPPTDRPR
jgi:hypothetical protein